MAMNIYIYTKTKDSAYGGGNQFLKALRAQFMQNGSYSEHAKDADAVIFNSYQDFKAIVRATLARSLYRRVWRLGPIFSLHRKGLKWKLVDIFTALCASICAHVVVFQSQWSYDQAKRFGFFKKKNVCIIPNAVDSSIFYKKQNSEQQTERIKLIYTSWSANENKGFSYFSFLDTYLDFKKYECHIVGNVPVSFSNITMHSPVDSKELAVRLRASDIFISPTKDDACSNAIIEALSCGLPVVALDSGGNGELVGAGGVLFTNEQELLRAIETVSSDIKLFQEKIVVPTIDQVADAYTAAIRASINSL